MFSALATEHIQRPRNSGPLEGETSVGRFGEEGGGPYMTIWLKVQEGVIRTAGFQSNGCPGSIACGSLATSLVTGRRVEEARKLTREDLIVVLGGLPEGREICADMAITALQGALGER